MLFESLHLNESLLVAITLPTSILGQIRTAENIKMYCEFTGRRIPCIRLRPIQAKIDQDGAAPPAINRGMKDDAYERS